MTARKSRYISGIISYWLYFLRCSDVKPLSLLLVINKILKRFLGK